MSWNAQEDLLTWLVVDVFIGWGFSEDASWNISVLFPLVSFHVTWASHSEGAGFQEGAYRCAKMEVASSLKSRAQKSWVTTPSAFCQSSHRASFQERGNRLDFPTGRGTNHLKPHFLQKAQHVPRAPSHQYSWKLSLSIHHELPIASVSLSSNAPKGHSYWLLTIQSSVVDRAKSYAIKDFL